MALLFPIHGLAFAGFAPHLFLPEQRPAHLREEEGNCHSKECINTMRASVIAVDLSALPALSAELAKKPGARQVPFPVHGFPTPIGRNTFVVQCKLCHRIPSGVEEFPFQPINLFRTFEDAPNRFADAHNFVVLMFEFDLASRRFRFPAGPSSS
jgi:hypothetical protein